MARAPTRSFMLSGGSYTGAGSGGPCSRGGNGCCSSPSYRAMVPVRLAAYKEFVSPQSPLPCSSRKPWPFFCLLTRFSWPWSWLFLGIPGAGHAAVQGFPIACCLVLTMLAGQAAEFKRKGDGFLISGCW